MKAKRKIKPVLAAILIIGTFCVLGFGLGFISGYHDFSLESIINLIKNNILYIVVPLFFLVTAFQLIFTLVAYSKAKKIYADWDGENEHIDKAELIIDITIGILSVSIIVLTMLVSIWAYISTNVMTEEQFTSTLLLGLAIYISLIGSAVFVILMQRACVQLVKRINPEKKGEIMSLNFDKVWEQSLDEAQKLTTFEVGYRAYKFTNKAFAIAWFICIVGMSYGFGLAPVITVSLLWLTMTISHIVYGYRIEHMPKDKKGRF